MTCNRCGENNFDWARECASCRAPLEPTAPAPDLLGPVTRPGSFTAEPGPTPLRIHDPLEDERARRDEFVHTLFTLTPHTFVTWIVMALNVAVFLLMVVNGASIVQPTLEMSMRWGASYGPSVTGGEWWRMVTATFVHAGIFHLFANMYVLYAMGPVTERLYGNAAYAVLYAIAGLAGSLASVWWHPLIPSVGASGAVFGVMGGVLAYAARQRHSLPPSLLRSIASSVGQAVAINLVLGFATPHVDMAAHVGGLLGGLASGMVLATSIETAASSRRRRAVAVAVVGALILVVGARQLPAYDDYLGAMTKAEKIELETQSRLQTLTKNPAADQKARDSVAKSITTDVLPPWVAVRNEVARLRLPRTEHAIAAQLVQYMDLRADGWKLAAEAYRTGDLRLVKESRDKAVAALAVQARMNNRPAPRQAPDDALDAAIAAQQAAVTWQKIAQQAVQADAKGVAAYNDGVRQFRARKISTTQMAQIVETQVIPPMREAHEAVAAFTPPPALKEPHDRLEAYGRLRIEAWTLRAQGLRKESADLMNQAANKDKEAAALTKK